MSIGDLAMAQPLLILAILAVLAASAGWMIERDHPRFARALRQSGYLGMLATGLLLVGGLAHRASRSDATLMLRERPSLSVSGGETVIPLAANGHYWVEASVNGRSIEFLVDTGATYTGITRRDAEVLGIRPDPQQLPIKLETANGTIEATLGRADELRLGNIVVRNLPVAVPTGIDDDTRVLGMNFLSTLASWRVEGERLILVPKAG